MKMKLYFQIFIEIQSWFELENDVIIKRFNVILYFDNYNNK